MVKIYIPSGQSILPLESLTEISAHVRSLFICKELVFSIIAHSGNKEKTKEMREGRRKRDLSLQTKKCPLSEGRVRKMMVHPCYYLVIKKNLK